MESILTSIKALLGLDESDESFDPDVTMFINSAFSVLSQNGVGPVTGFKIQDKSTTWTSFIADDLRLEMVKTYIYWRVRLAFDPPSTSFTIKAFQDMAAEELWRLNAYKGGETWPEPTPS